jgi:hypothetical protein
LREHKSIFSSSSGLGLRAGDWVEVRSTEEILATLDERARLDALPFMPEMLEYCGKQFRVYKSAHKTCDTIEHYNIPRRMTNAVHLEGLRCDGAAHGGCQAGCLIFWKEAWLKRVPDPRPEATPATVPARSARACDDSTDAQCDTATLYQETRAQVPDAAADGSPRYSCQATELLKATTPMQWWWPGPYLKDLTTGNVRLSTMIRYGFLAAYNMAMRKIAQLNWRGQVFVWPYIQGLGGEKTPTVELNLQPGELVRVRSKYDIMCTLNRAQKNRGLYFSVAMVQYCGNTYRVLRRVEKILDEKSGKMLHFSGSCVILDGVICTSLLTRYRLFCPRSVYSFWHEIWLERVGQAKTQE